MTEIKRYSLLNMTTTGLQHMTKIVVKAYDDYIVSLPVHPKKKIRCSEQNLDRTSHLSVKLYQFSKTKRMTLSALHAQNKNICLKGESVKGVIDAVT